MIAGHDLSLIKVPLSSWTVSGTGWAVAMLDTHIFKLNEYFVELNPAKFKVLNRILN